MLYWVLTLFAALLALLVLALGFKLLWNRHWLLGWLRGSIGLVLIAVAVMLGLIGWDLHRYRALAHEEPIANLAFTRVQPQQFKVVLVDAEGMEHQFELQGDLWQLDVRMIKWNPSLAQLGISPGYQLDRLSGRYLALEQEQKSPRSVHGLGAATGPVDLWQLLQQWQGLGGLVDARYGSAAYLPMADGALFSVSLGQTGLVARPLNERAKEAVEGWL